MRRGVLCAGTQELAAKLAPHIPKLEYERDWVYKNHGLLVNFCGIFLIYDDDDNGKECASSALYIPLALPLAS